MALNIEHDAAAFRVCGRIDGQTVKLWGRTEAGDLAMDVTATLA